ncbi:O-linked N-acetylglucosamine transferase, SPINDLY family protein [Pseudodesulfovibrio portus]|uniref:protein O-GlcNAc transferase n=1 Tax=Pseudodesulfovibrio portus TaxID=231439 RepID=A0ABN6RP70_9BACT|nr:tetratricopeptide repeat protein [Pseudodesulfovibrio portus]BDQ32634.1 hypothetical protein JCM14722_01760 [Pseudodesulfovibrio portus]
MEQAIVNGYNDASRLLMENKLDAALAVCLSLLKQAPGNSAVLNLAGSTLYRKKMLPEAESLLLAANEIAPEIEEITLNLVRVLRKRKRIQPAINILEQRLACNPASSRMLSTLGEIFYYDSQFAAAARVFEQLLTIEPGNVDGLFRLACAYQECDMTEAAFDAYWKILALSPDHPDAHVNLAQIYKSLGNHAKSLELFQRAADLVPGDPAHASRALFCLNYTFAEGSRLLEKAMQWADKHTDCLSSDQPLARRKTRADGRIGLGFISADYTRHPVGKLFLPVLKCLDRDRFDVHCFSNVDIEDDMTALYRSVAPNFNEIHHLDDRSACSLIQSRDIDILVDLSGHSNGNRLGVLARKCAPVQIMWLGYFNTTGVAAMDYVLADEINVPPGQEAFYREKVLRLADSFFPYVPSSETAPAKRDQAAPINFGCFNDSGKINDTVLTAWAAILENVPKSRIYLKSRTFSDQWVKNLFLDRAMRLGIAPHRIIFLGPSDYDAYIKDYAKVDIALDPFPYSGGATTADALSTGTPVLTCPFDSFGSRLSASILSACDLDNLVCTSIEDYIARTVRLGTDHSLLTTTTDTLLRNFASSRFCDVERFTRNFEQVLLTTLN